MYRSVPSSHNNDEVFYMKRMLLCCSLFFFSPLNSLAEEAELSTDCKKMLEETKAQYVQLVMGDVLSSYDLLEKVEGNALYFTTSEIWKNDALMGKSEILDSLKKLMSGKYRGEKRLYFFNQDPSIGNILYKDINNNNIMLTIKKKANKWVEIERQVKEGKEINIEVTECNDKHFMQKMFDNLYP